ncbi:MAG TPA: heavy-metal-associated domain-containing protein [Terracidiphilus sp.]|nr:heavy-metal-associated domain-containing protein [Terracidiphilus sp.]
MAQVTLQIDGMHCGSCVRRVSQALASTPGIEVKEVRMGAARIEAGDEAAAAELAVSALARAGYRAIADQTQPNGQAQPNDRR